MGASQEWMADAPLMTAWRRFVGSDPAPFTIPGHKRRAGGLHPDLGRLLDADVPLYGGADSMKLTGGVLADAESRAAAPLGRRPLSLLHRRVHPRQPGALPDHRPAR